MNMGPQKFSVAFYKIRFCEKEVMNKVCEMQCRFMNAGMVSTK